MSEKKNGPPPSTGGDQVYRIWAGPGSGQPCHECGHKIDAGQVEYEVEQPGAAPEQPRIRFHLTCLDMWRERQLPGIAP